MQRNLAINDRDAEIAVDADYIEAALKIQAMHRGRNTRQEMKAQQAAAAKIQAIQRGKMHRRNVQQQKEQRAASAKIQAMQRGKAQHRPLATVSTSANDSVMSRSLTDLGLGDAVEYFSASLGGWQRGTVIAVHGSELQIQYGDRGRVVDIGEERVEKILRRAEDEDEGDGESEYYSESEVEEGEAGGVGIDNSADDNCVGAALKIQALHRGRNVRREIKEQAHAAAKIQAIH
eukprot:SAG11_NODE_5436_length_1561_cov_0.871409_1_plen_232_part_10